MPSSRPHETAISTAWWQRSTQMLSFERTQGLGRNSCAERIAVARRASLGAQAGREARRALINGAAGGVVFVGEKLVSVMAFLVDSGRILEIDVLADPERLSRPKLPALVRATGRRCSPA